MAAQASGIGVPESQRLEHAGLGAPITLAVAPVMAVQRLGPPGAP